MSSCRIAASADSGPAPTKDDPAFFSQSSKCRHARWATAGPAQRNEWAATCHKVLSVWIRPYSIPQHSATNIRHLWHPVSRHSYRTHSHSYELSFHKKKRKEIIFKTQLGAGTFYLTVEQEEVMTEKGTAVAPLSLIKEHVIQCNTWLRYCALAFKWSLFPKICTVNQFSHLYLLSRLVREV